MKPLRAAAVLDVGLAVGARGRQERGVDLREEARELVGDLGLEAAALLDPGVGRARAALGLHLLDRGGEGDVAEDAVMPSSMAIDRRL